jgi:uncharacterized membrane protein YphA (DoxX/SURF4 family)
MAIAAVIIRLLLSVIFFRAAWHKFNDRSRFQSELAAYQLLPSPLLPAIIPMLVALELATALLLLQLSSHAGLLLGAALLLIYASAMAINLQKGRTNIDCGCGGPLAARKTISWLLVLRNLALAVFAVSSLSPHTPELTASSALLVLAGGTCALLIYEAVEQAIANSQRYRQWRAKQAVKP